MNRSLPPGARGLATIVGFLVVVELASGVLQGYYTPIFSDIADHLGIQDILGIPSVLGSLSSLGILGAIYGLSLDYL